MKPTRLLIMLSAFLIMISSVFSLYSTPDRTPVYLNIAAMVCLVFAVSVLNFNKSKDKK
ncbi:hypothetical protein LJB85_00575 [Porphyromonadaceae bacterium OttesenSCG-928-L07]|nr:hypothetical protein [Porphyromonadaceae bacterium OttesenSCG-928-L07]MDL2252280.1 hypothetical protein [Odoribacter sp. OttesenSCG-928-J03]MDL2330774.1 hypothetical protein [Odoribacter sp. OttesenSCG-928-A06]